MVIRPPPKSRHRRVKPKAPPALPPAALTLVGATYDADTGPTLRLTLKGRCTSFTNDGGAKREIFYQKDADRGYESRGLLWSPGWFSVEVLANAGATLIASTEVP